MQKQLLNDLETVIDSLKSSDNTTAKSVLKKFQHLKYNIKNTDFELVSDPLITILQNQLRNSLNQKSNPNNLNSYINTILNSFPNPINSKRSKSESSKIIDEIRSEADAQIGVLKEQRNQIEEEFKALKDRNQVLNEEIERLKQKSDTEATRLDALVADELRQFMSKKADIDKLFSEIKSDIDDKFDEYRNKNEKEFGNIISSAETNTKKIEELYSLASKTSVSGFFANIASEQKKSADIYRILASLAYGAIPVIFLLLYLQDPSASLSLSSVVSKLAISSTLLLPAIYFSRESTKHRVQQFENQRTGIRTQGFEPFIEKLSDDDVSELRKKMVIEWFTDKEKDKEKKEPLIGYSLSKVTKLIEAISKLELK